MDKIREGPTLLLGAGRKGTRDSTIRTAFHSSLPVHKACAGMPVFSPPPLSLQCPTALLDPCSCTFSDHVLCSNDRITSLNLAFQSLPGPFPTSLLNLTGLTGLSLYGNR